MDHYERSAYLAPLWEGHVVENETVFPLAEADGSVPDIPLLYPAAEILEVRSSDLGTLYREGTDYVLADGNLRILPGGAIPVMPHDGYFFPEKKQGASFGCTLGGYIFFGEKDSMHVRQIAVTYRHDDLWNGYLPTPKGFRLPRTHALLEAKKPLRVLVYGDSISTGANSSGCIGSAPFAEDWCHMVTGALADRYGAPVELVNTAVGGTGSGWGLENAAERGADQHPDLAIIAFGMNDGGKEPEEEAKIISQIRAVIAQANPECEFLILATMLPHRIVSGFYGKQEGQLAYLLTLECRGTAVCNLTSMHAAFLTRKRYYDMSGNNVNHPNDFLARMYAQTILATLEK